jgi:hypothetical protein
VDSQIGAVTIGGKPILLSFQRFIDPGDGQNSLTGFSPGAQSLGITSSYQSDAQTTIFSGLAPTYSITESFQTTLNAGSSTAFNSHTILTDPPALAPEPSTSLLVALDPVVGGRRRHVAAHD